MSFVLEVENLAKTFGQVAVLSNVAMRVAPGEVHALLGQNGSGKSTLIKILSGYHAPDEGARIRIDGKELAFEAPGQSHRLGCRFVQQDLGLVENMSVLDNLALGYGYPLRLGTIRRSASIAQARRDLERVGLAIDPRRLVSTLGASERTAVAIARALREDEHAPPRLLVLDEPTATLPVDEVERLLDMVRRMAASGVGVLYVTHHLGEVFEIAHTVSILRDGEVVGTGNVGDFNHDSLISLLTREESPIGDGAAPKGDGNTNGRASTLEVDHLRAGMVREASFSVSGGEIVGVAGLAGSGRETLLGAVFGAVDREGGEIRIDGELLPPGRPDRSIGAGIAYLAPDRKTAGGVMTLSARENMTLPRPGTFWRGLRLRQRAERAVSRDWFERLGVRPAQAVDQPLGVFSGGNQQKILFGKWLLLAPAVFLLDEPTQGVDVGAQADLHRELKSSAAAGTAVVVSSSDLKELADLCDRVIVMVDGRIRRELRGVELTEASITRSFMPLAAETLTPS